MSEGDHHDALTDVPPQTPVLVGVGQFTERIDAEGYEAMSPVQLAAEAVTRAVADAGCEVDLIGQIDLFAATRQFENSRPDARAPLGRSNNFPRSVADRVGGKPARVVLATAGGQSPQQLVGHLGTEISSGRCAVAVAFGAEAMSTVRHLLASGQTDPVFAEETDPAVEDHGFGLSGMVSRHLRLHGLTDAPAQYALLENARRAQLSMGREDYRTSIARLLAPMSARAAANAALASDLTARSAQELAEQTAANRPIVDPYLRRMVARDQVNQSAAVLMMSTAEADRLGIAPERRVYLHGHADAADLPLLERPDLGTSHASREAFVRALDMADATVEDIEAFDLYSCFPVPVFQVCDSLGIGEDDPRPLTLTGGLPFFGAPGNNYSMHAIAEAVQWCRSSSTGLAAVGANGGIVHKYSVGIYSSRPRTWGAAPSEGPRTPAKVAVDHHPEGWGRIETFTTRPDDAGSTTGTVFGRLEVSGRRFVARSIEGDKAALELLARDQPVGSRVYVRSDPSGNVFATDPETVDHVLPRSPARWEDDRQHVRVKREGHILTVTIDREERRNAIHPPAHAELDAVFDAYFADPDLWVAIITGAGSAAFCAGNDLIHTARSGPTAMPASGFAGLTSRRGMTKPVIAAVNGYAFGGGFELALAAHLVVADETATFALPEVKVGLAAGAGGLVRLPRAVPQKLATELILTGRRMGADEAFAHGLVNEVAPAGHALERAGAMAREIAKVSPTSVRASLSLMDLAARVPDAVEAIEAGSGVVDDLLATQDCHEGVAAFAEKREPRWVNR